MSDTNSENAIIEFDRQIRCKLVEAKLSPPTVSTMGLTNSIVGAIASLSPVVGSLRINGSVRSANSIRTGTSVVAGSLSSNSSAASAASNNPQLLNTYAAVSIDEESPIYHHPEHNNRHHRRHYSKDGDSRWEKTSPIFGNNSPFWGEEFQFNRVDADKINGLSVAVLNRDSDRAIGKFKVPAPLISSNQMEEEQWLPLLLDDQENNVSGELRIRLSLIPAIGSQSCRFSVTGIYINTFKRIVLTV
jgi:hypothetical protein